MSAEIGTLAHRAEIYADELKAFETYCRVSGDPDKSNYVGRVISDNQHRVAGLEIVHKATINLGDLYVPYLALDSWALGEIAPREAK